MSARPRAAGVREVRLRLAFALVLTLPMAFVLARSGLRGPLAPALLWLVLAALLFARLAQGEERAQAAAARLPGASVGPRPPTRVADAARALGISAALLLLAPLLALLVSGALELVRGEGPGELASDLAREGARAPGPARPSSGGAAAAAFGGAFPAELEWATARPLPDDTPIVVVRASGTTSLDGLAPLYLRGRVLERFTASGIETASSAEWSALEPEAHGWSPLPGTPPRRDGHLELALEQLPLALADDPRSPLFVPTPLLELASEDARVNPAGELRVPFPASGALVFAARALEGRFERVDLPPSAARDAPPATLALPPDSAELAVFRALARELAAGARDDRERVARVLDHFRTRFRHEPEPDGLDGLAGLVRFLERRAGGCTHFAASATLLLRSLGVPARVATGFLARPGPEGATTLVATPRSAHAWVEVPFEGLGWVTCDPTPGPEGAAELAARAETRHALSGGLELFTSFLEGTPLRWSRVRGAVREARARLGPAAWLLVLAPAALLALARLALAGLRRRRRGAARGARTQERGSSALARLTQALSRAGWPRPPARTLREHARELARRSDGLAPVAEAAEALYAARFGGRPWSRDDEAALGRALAALNVPERS